MITKFVLGLTPERNGGQTEPLPDHLTDLLIELGAAWREAISRGQAPTPIQAFDAKWTTTTKGVVCEIDERLDRIPQMLTNLPLVSVTVSSRHDYVVLTPGTRRLDDGGELVVECFPFYVGGQRHKRSSVSVTAASLETANRVHDETLSPDGYRLDHEFVQPQFPAPLVSRITIHDLGPLAVELINRRRAAIMNALSHTPPKTGNGLAQLHVEELMLRFLLQMKTVSYIVIQAELGDASPADQLAGNLQALTEIWPGRVIAPGSPPGP